MATVTPRFASPPAPHRGFRWATSFFGWLALAGALAVVIAAAEAGQVPVLCGDDRDCPELTGITAIAALFLFMWTVSGILLKGLPEGPAADPDPNASPVGWNCSACDAAALPDDDHCIHCGEDFTG